MSTLKVLISSDFSALRKGEFVKATGAGEFILSTKTGDDLTNGHPLAAGQLKEVAQANGCAVGSKDNRKTLVAKLAEHFEAMEIPTVNDKPESEQKKELATQIISECRDQGKSDDEIIIALFSNTELDVKLKQASTLFKEVSTENGWMLSKKDRQNAIDAILEAENFTCDENTEYSVVEALVVRIAGDDETEGEVGNTTDKQALAAIRAFAKRNEFTLPKKAKKKGGGGSNSFKAKMLEWCAANPTASDEELRAQIVELDKGDRVDAYAQHYGSIQQACARAVELAAQQAAA